MYFLVFVFLSVRGGGGSVHIFDVRILSYITGGIVLPHKLVTKSIEIPGAIIL